MRRRDLARVVVMSIAVLALRCAAHPVQTEPTPVTPPAVMTPEVPKVTEDDLQAIRAACVSKDGGGASDQVQDAECVVIRMRADFRACFHAALGRNAESRGQLRLVAHVGAGGRVDSVQPTGGERFDRIFFDCVVARVRRAIFMPPLNGGATVIIPILLEIEEPRPQLKP